MLRVQDGDKEHKQRVAAPFFCSSLTAPRCLLQSKEAISGELSGCLQPQCQAVP